MRLFCYVYLFFTLFFGLVLSEEGWHYYPFDIAMRHSSIKIDSNDLPHIVYGSQDGNLMYAYWDGSKWNYDKTEFDGLILGVGQISLCLDKNNNPHISCYEYNSKSLVYINKINDKWNYETVDDYADEAGGYNSINLDLKGFPHIAYEAFYESGYIYQLRYAYFDGNKWNIEILNNNGYIPSIKIDSLDYPHISYGRKYQTDIYYLSYIYWDGSQWVKEDVDTSGFAGFPSIDLDTNNNPCIAYFGKGGLWYAKKVGDEWTKEYVDKCGLNYISLALDSNNYPHISYKSQYGLGYAYFNGREWIKEIPIYGPTCGQFSNSIDLDSKGKPHIACDVRIDYSYLIYYVWYGNGLGITLTSFSAKPGSSAITLNWSISTDEDISGFNLYRRIIAPFTVSTVRENSYSPSCSPAPVGEIAQSPPNPDNDYVWTKVNTSLITGTNPYSYTDRDITPDTNYEYKLEAVVSDRQETLGTTSVDSGRGTPESFDIVRIYPTPADDRISIDVIIPEQSDIDIAIYDITGRRVATVASGLYNSGEYTITGDVSGLTNGVYIMRMTAGGLSASKRFVVAK